MIRYITLHSDALMMHDRSRRDWTGHAVELQLTNGSVMHMIVDRVEDHGDGVWRMYLIPPD